jgi:hypothetical protein
MILSVSRRTDIPAFYSDWFINRLREGYVLVPNPYNSKRLSRIELSPENIDCIVFWTKNAFPMFDKLEIIEKFGYEDYYFEFTITPYDESIEKHLPSKSEVVGTFQRLSDRIGADRVDWRFDPVIINKQITEQWLLDQFGVMCHKLAGYTTKCIISFVDIYRHSGSTFMSLSPEKQEYIAKHLVEIASSYNLKLYTCCEEYDLNSYGINHSACIDKDKIESITGCRLTGKKDNGQRKNCGCMESIDIGIYNSCSHECTYCYATNNKNTVDRRKKLHDKDSPMLIGFPTGEELVTARAVDSLKDISLPHINVNK